MASSSTYNDGAEHTFFAVRDNARTGKLYVDNTLVAEDTDNNGSAGSIDIATDLAVGYNLVTNGSHFTGEIRDIRIFNHVINVSQRNQVNNDSVVTTGNVTTWYEASSQNETAQIVVNTTTPTNSNYTIFYCENTSGTFTQVGGVRTGNVTVSLSPAYLNTDVRLVLLGNGTATPEIMSITFNEQSESDTTPPASITSLLNYTTNTYHLWTWVNPIDDDFNHTMVYINGVWTINQSEQYYNLSAIVGNTSTISTHTVDTSGNVNTTWVNHTSIIKDYITIACNGWSYIAMNYTSQTLNQIDTNLSNDVVQAKYNNSIQKYQIHRTGRSLFEDYTVEQRWGYCVYFSSATNVYVTIPDTILPIDLLSGWNLVGHLSHSNTTIGDVLNDIGTNATVGCYNNVCTNATTVTPGTSLMVYVTDNTTWDGN